MNDYTDLKNRINAAKVLPVEDEKIRKINPNVFVVMISASKDHKDAKHQYDPYLKKPLSFKVMIYVIKEIIRKLKL